MQAWMTLADVKEAAMYGSVAARTWCVEHNIDWTE